MLASWLFIAASVVLEVSAYVVLVNTTLNINCATKLADSYVAFVFHGHSADPSNWSNSIMTSQWWDPAVAMANITSSTSDEFVVRCLGETFTCRNSTNTSAGAACNNANFEVTQPVAGSFVVDITSPMATISATCAFMPSCFRPFGGANSANTLFVPSGSTAKHVGPVAPCSGNGKCNLVSAQCTCSGLWQGPKCDQCACPAGEFCSVVSGACAASPSGAPPPQSNLQGVTVIVATKWWFGDQNGVVNNTTLHFNSGNVTTDDYYWTNAVFTAVNTSDPRVSADLAAYANDDWMMVVVPGNLVQFVIYLRSITTYIHCDDSIAVDVSTGVRCFSDDLNGNRNFVTSAGVTILSNYSLSRVQPYPFGCQYSTGDSPLLCSGHGTCHQETYFRCNCLGNFTGVACEVCNCGANLTCTNTGMCACIEDGFQFCSANDNLCTDLLNDADNCGSCGNDCTKGMQNAVQSASCVDGVCNVEMKSPLVWLLCVSSITGVRVACFRGYDFLIIMLISFFLVFGSVTFLVRYRISCPYSHQHRQALFVLLAGIGALRLSYSIVAVAMFGQATTPSAAISSRRFFEWSMITLNAFADLLTGFIDLLLTVYWLFVLDRVVTFPKRLLLTAYGCMTVTLLAATTVDYASATKTFDYTFFTLAMLLFFTALLHMIVIAEVIIKMSCWEKSEQEEGDKAVSHSPSRFRRISNLYAALATNTDEESRVVSAQLVRISAIALVCLVCWTLRSVMLLGRAAGAEIFVTGSLSFANADFVLVYFTALTMLPCVIIAVVFFKLSYQVISTTSGVHRQRPVRPPLSTPEASLLSSRRMRDGDSPRVQSS